MNKICFSVFVVILLLFPYTFVSAQDKEENEKELPEQIEQPKTAYLFDEYNSNNITIEDEKQKIETLVLQIKNMPGSHAYIYVYRGKSDFKFNPDKRISLIDKALSSNLESNSLEPFRAFARFAGFREESTIEMVIVPYSAERKATTPTVTLFDVRYYDDTTLQKGTIQKTGKELLDNLIKKVEPPFPAAAKAVRAFGEVGVLIKIDEKGNVAESKAFLGHPLLRSACVAATRQWQFKPEKQKSIAVKVVGIAVCEFNLSDD